MEKVFYSTKKIIKKFAEGGNILIVATVLALLIANMPVLGEWYKKLWELPVSLEVGGFNVFSHNGHTMTLMQFINDALMVVFFFTVGLEIKREVLIGELASVRKALLPIIGACGGMIVPVIVFFSLAYGSDYANGCAIPMATDIAFSLGVLAMLGSRVPLSLKVFLTTLAVVDDIGGIMVIAIFYSSDINYMMLLYSLAVIALLLIGANVWKIKNKLFYLGLGAVVWYLFLNSGIHATIAGVIVAFCVPATPRFESGNYINTMRDRLNKFSDNESSRVLDSRFLSKEQIDWLKEMESASDKVISPLQDLEDSLQSLVNYIIIPLFAFANAGVIFEGMSLSAVYSGVGLAVICGLVIGKFVGIFSFSWAAIKMGIAPRPTGSNWKMLGGVAMLGGIGFTVSLFIATLSYGGAEFATILNDAKLGILIGSLLSGFLGYTYLSKVLPKDK